jgi:ankyrin repeat protein
MLLNIASTCVEYSKSMLTLLCCARRPLTVPELVDGIAVELGSPPKFNPSRRLETVEALHEVCPGFIEVDEEVSGKAATVRIAHFSVQEYLESERILRGGAAKFSVRKIDAHSDVACICVTYLLDPALSASTNHETEFPLSLYAARSWPEHIREGDEKKPHVQQQTLRLFQSVEKFESWVSIWNVDDYYGRKPAGVVSSPVYYASLLGLYELLSRLLSGNTLTLSEETVSRLVNAQGGEYGNALQASSARGYEAVVRLLLEKHADVNAQGGYYGTALQAASAEGHVNIVQLLLQRNAKVHARGGEYGNALYAASARGHEVIVRLLLSKGADVNARGGEYGNALYAASARGDKGIVQMLLDGNAKINAQSSGYGTALYAASSRGHEAVVRILLERNAAVDAQGGEYGHALYAATSRGYEAIVRLLLDKNANVNALAGFYGSALQAASAGGHNKIFNLLQARSAQRNTMSVSEQRKSIAQRAESIRLSKNLMEMKPFDQTTAERKGRRGTGAVGLTNLGNTGYMASPLQCLRSVEELTSYFLTGEYANDLNKQNPLGYNGEVAIAYCNLLNDLYHTSNDSIRPSNFKKTIASFVPSFSGQGQGSAQEFLGMLIDGLQEDLSRVKKKPYIEKPISTDDMVHNDVAISKMADEIWNITMKRDDSVVMDLFTGLYKSTLKCPVCQKIDISFDPFISFTLQLPKEPAMWTHTVVFFPLNDSPVQIQVEILETSAVVDMKHFVSNRTGVPVRRLICAEQFKCQFWQIFDDLTEIGGIRENDLVTMHELAVSPTHLVVQGVQQLEFLTISKLKTSKRNMNTLENARYKHVIVPVIHRRGNEEIRKLNHDGVPAHFIALDREEV